jgi:hypothetical protein
VQWRAHCLNPLLGREQEIFYPLFNKKKGTIMSQNTTYRDWILPGVFALVALVGGILFFRLPATQTPAPQVLTATEEEQGENIKEQTVMLSIVAPEETLEYEIEIAHEMTVAELLEKATHDHDLTVDIDETSFGLFVTTIAGIPDEDGTGGYWTFLINGEQSPVGISDAMVTQGDTVVWTYKG